ncbi:MAG: thioredoxin domain-containing protein [Gemmatimonas sp.]|nr:thioredoxin domain-containing protein [Gemmatimonas sp.]
MAKSKKPSGAASKVSASGGQNRLYLILGVVALLVIGGIAYFSGGGGQAATEPLAMEMDPAELQRTEGVPMGEGDAPVLLYEFADYQCPACAQFSTFLHPLLEERLVDQGIVRLVRYDFPLVQVHPHAFLAARAARCAGDQDAYWEFHDVLYGRQPSWSPARNPASEFGQYAEAVGIDEDVFATCLNSDRYAEEVTRNLQLGESLGVQGTPTLMLNGERIDVRDYNDLEQRVFDAAGISPSEEADVS